MKTTKKALISSVLALFLCFSMLVGTTYAWFTDSVTSAGNIITAGTLDVTMEWAEGDKDPANTTWTDASTGAMFDYANWEPGYVEAKHIKISNVGSLALNYKLRIVANGIVSKLANVIDVYVFDQAKKIDRSSFEGKTPLGNLAQVLGSGEGSTKVLHKYVKGGLEAGEVRDLTLALKMKESAGNEYQGLELGTFSIELIATQQSFESDSFGKDYDAVVPDESIPYAFVTELDDLDITYTMGIGGAESTTTLDAGYKFEPTIGDELNDNDPSTNNEYTSDSKYMNWHTDFYVYADRTIDTSDIMLAGWYSAWCDAINGGRWVALTGEQDQMLDAGVGIRLVEFLREATNSSICVTYEDIYNYGNDGKGFQCGLAAVDADALAGTTITVELRLYETEGKWNDASHTCSEVTPENYITAGKFTYTFPKAVANQDEFNEAAAQGGTITLAEGVYKMPSNNSTAALTITGTKATVIDNTLGAYMDSANVTFKGVTIKTSTGYANGNGSDYAAFYGPNATYIDCTFVGPMRVGRDGAKFINCTFTELGNDYVWTYGNDVTFEGCTFNTDGKAILIYSDGGNEVSEVSVKNCKFNSTKGAKAGAIANQNCAAIEIHNYGNGVNLVTEGNTYDSNFSGEWRIKTYESGKPAIKVNGTTYTQIAIDGKLMAIDANNNVTVQ